MSEVVTEAAEKNSNSRLHMSVALMVALVATFMAVSKVKDDNIVQRMQQLQADRVDQWAYYQAKGTKENLAVATVAQMEALREIAAGQTTGASARIGQLLDAQKQSASRYAKEKEEIRVKAEAAGRDYDDLGRIDDMFDLSDAALSVALALFAITALTGRKTLFGVAMVLTGFGIAFGLSGFLGWNLHPEWLVKLLT